MARCPCLQSQRRRGGWQLGVSGPQEGARSIWCTEQLGAQASLTRSVEPGVKCACFSADQMSGALGDPSAPACEVTPCNIFKCLEPLFQMCWEAQGPQM